MPQDGLTAILSTMGWAETLNAEATRATRMELENCMLMFVFLDECVLLRWFLDEVLREKFFFGALHFNRQIDNGGPRLEVL